MPASGHLHPKRSDGSKVDATFEVRTVPVFEIVYHHKAGGRNSPRSVNADYHEGLELLLDRLARLGATVLGISVDSAVARELDPESRELGLEFPIELASRTDLHEVRLDITRAQKSVARRPDAQAGGGNDQKRILITLTAGDPRLSYERLRQALVRGEDGDPGWTS